MKFKLFFVITFFAFFTRASFAERGVISSFDIDKKSTLGLGYSWGKSRGDIPEDSYSSYGLYNVFYDYRLTKHFSIDVRYFNGDTTDAFCIVTCRESLSEYFTRYDIKFEGVSISGKGALKLSRRWTVFARIGLNSFDKTRYGNYQDIPVDESTSGNGLYAAVGMEFRTFNGIGVTLEAQHFDLDGIRLTSPTVNVSYQF